MICSSCSGKFSVTADQDRYVCACLVPYIKVNGDWMTLLAYLQRKTQKPLAK